MESLRADVSETRFHSFIPQILSEHLPCAQEKYQVNRWLEYTKWTKVGKNPPPRSLHSSRTEGKQYGGCGVGRLL